MFIGLDAKLFLGLGLVLLLFLLHEELTRLHCEGRKYLWHVVGHVDVEAGSAVLP